VTDAHPTPAERFATMLRWLSGAVAAISGGDRLSYLLIGHIIDRIRGIKQRFARLAAAIREGRYAPRSFVPCRNPAARRPRRPGPLPQNFGWLLPLVPDAVCYRSQLEHLLRDPEMVALLAEAPASLARPLRSLCWMLRVAPPANLAPARPARPPPPPPPHAAPPPRACGPPLPA
jgi:hypothetical protein